jgi:hypothetical protein
MNRESLTTWFFTIGPHQCWSCIIHILVWLVPLAQVLPHLQLIFPSKTWFFWEFIWIFSSRNHLKTSHSESKSYQINPPHQDLSNNTKKHIPIPLKFSGMIWFDLIFSEEIIQYSQELLHPKSKRHGTKPHAPLLAKSFPKTPRTWSEASQFTPPHQELSKGTKNMIWSIPVHPSSPRAFQRHQEHNLKPPSSANSHMSISILYQSRMKDKFQVKVLIISINLVWKINSKDDNSLELV